MDVHYRLYMNQTGYSCSAQEYVLALHQSKVPISICPYNTDAFLGVSRARRQFFDSITKKTCPKGCILIHHAVPGRYQRLPGVSKVGGLCVYESITLPTSWAKRMDQTDFIVTASKFNEGIFKENGVNKPVFVVPHCFDRRMFHRDVQTSGRYGRKTFISIGQWKQRKNWPVLIDAFYAAFTDKDNVCLLIKTDRPERLKAQIVQTKSQKIWRSKSTAPIYCDPSSCCDFEQIPSIMRRGDYYISASRSEGFGLPGLHAMALGIPVITVKFGGALEYATPETCTYIEPKGYERVASMDNIPQFRNAIFPVITSDEVASKMRSVFENPPIEKAAYGYNMVHSNFSYEAIGPRFAEVIANVV